MKGNQGGRQEFELGLGLGALDFDALRRWSRAADEEGFAFVSVGDNPALLKETYVSLTLLALSTERCRVGTAVTNPVHRDVLVVAAALASVASLAPGRTFLGIATGRARKPATLLQLRDHVKALRELWETGHTTYHGESLDLAWDARPVPVMVCASGPRALRLAGEIGDGVLIETGVSSQAVEEARAHVAKGAEEAGRDPETLELWWYLKTAIAETREEALQVAVGPIAASGAFVLGADPVARGVPERFQASCRELLAGYSMAAHMRTDADDPNRQLISDPDLLEYLTDRFALVGTARDWLTRVKELRGRGIDRVFCAAVVPDMDYFIKTVGAEVIPSVLAST